MKISTFLTGLMASTALARPLQAESQAPSAKMIHPAVSALTETTLALDKVVSSIRAFDGKSERDARRLEVDSFKAISMLNNATNSLNTQPDIDYITALQFVPVAPGLFAGAYSLVNALNEKKAVLQSTPDFAQRTLNVLESTNAGVQNLVQALNRKLPSAVAFILKGLDDDVVRKIQEARDQYRSVTAAVPAADAGADPFAWAAQPVGPQQPAAYPAYPSYGQPQQQEQQQRPQQPRPQQQQQQQQFPQYQPYPQPSSSNSQSQAVPQFPAFQPAEMDV